MCQSQCQCRTWRSPVFGFVWCCSYSFQTHHYRVRLSSSLPSSPRCPLSACLLLSQRLPVSTSAHHVVASSLTSPHLATSGRLSHRLCSLVSHVVYSVISSVPSSDIVFSLVSSSPRLPTLVVPVVSPSPACCHQSLVYSPSLFLVSRLPFVSFCSSYFFCLVLANVVFLPHLVRSLISSSPCLAAPRPAIPSSRPPSRFIPWPALLISPAAGLVH